MIDQWGQPYCLCGDPRGSHRIDTEWTNMSRGMEFLWCAGEEGKPCDCIAGYRPADGSAPRQEAVTPDTLIAARRRLKMEQEAEYAAARQRFRISPQEVSA